jgi:CHAT domain-containing protein
MLELLARGRIGAVVDTAGGLIAREEDLRRRIVELSVEQTDDLEDARDANVRAMEAMARQSLSQAQDAYAELLLEMQERTPHHAQLVAPRTRSVREVAERLASDEAFVEYLVSDTGALAFIITRDSFAIRDLGASRADLRRLVDFALGTLARPAGTVTDSLWRGPLQQLRRELITPLEESGLLTAVTRLVIVPHAELHYLPFAALLDSTGQFLIQRYELARTPSASVWLMLGERARQHGAQVLALAPRPGALPASSREVELIGRLTDTRVLTGPAASEAAFRREAGGRRVLHLATYGSLNKTNPLFSFVQLQSGDGHDGRLEVHEVFGLTLSADLVVLSACQTALGSGALSDVPPGDDWVGLTRAFLHAGAADVVATLWSVDDWATASLMEQFYGRYSRRADAAAALAEAQRAILTMTSTRHPFYWAGFTAVGEGGRGVGR